MCASEGFHFRSLFLFTKLLPRFFFCWRAKKKIIFNDPKSRGGNWNSCIQLYTFHSVFFFWKLVLFFSVVQEVFGLSVKMRWTGFLVGKHWKINSIRCFFPYFFKMTSGDVFTLTLYSFFLPEKLVAKRVSSWNSIGMQMVQEICNSGSKMRKNHWKKKHSS